jgi:hypothetical protein
MFVIVVVMATVMDWSTTDLVWSLWLSSLVLGYSFILTTAVAMLFHRPPNVSPEKWAKLKSTPAGRLTILGVGAFSAILTVSFFTVHFLVFHIVHAMFLNDFFPLIPGRSLNSGPDPFDRLPLLLTYAIPAYWPFVVASGLSRLHEYRAVLTTPPTPLAIVKPYINVVRMHAMILIFAFLSAAGLTSYVTSYGLYALLLFYFFPIGALVRSWSKESRKQQAAYASR